MGVEIERKFLVVGDDWKAAPSTHYCQGYLSADPNCTVRVRLAGQTGVLTVKGRSENGVRQEFEYEIPMSDVPSLLKLCALPPVEKRRYRVPFEGLVWEVDEFLAENAGLVVAEVELASIDQAVPLPPWVGEEVTHDLRYHNSQLARHPYSQW